MHELIRSNKRRSALLVAAFVVVVALVGTAFGLVFGGGIAATLIALVIGGLIAFTSYWQADKIALQNAAARGELLDSRKVANEWRAIVTDLRAAVVAVPSRGASRLALDRKETAALDAEIRDAMEAIAADAD